MFQALLCGFMQNYASFSAHFDAVFLVGPPLSLFSVKLSVTLKSTLN